MTHLSPETILDYVHGALAPEDDAVVFSHLASCATCRAERDEEVRIGEELRTEARAAELEFPSMISARVWETVRASRPGPFAALAAFLRPIVAVPVAAVVLVAAYFASPLGHGAEHRSTIDASYYLQQHAGQATDTLNEHGSSEIIESSLVSQNDAPETLEEGEAAASPFVETAGVVH